MFFLIVMVGAFLAGTIAFLAVLVIFIVVVVFAALLRLCRFAGRSSLILLATLALPLLIASALAISVQASFIRAAATLVNSALTGLANYLFGYLTHCYRKVLWVLP